MNILIVVCIYDRFENLRRWIHAWEQCEQLGAKLYIVNNFYDGIDTNFWSDYCKVRNVNYIHRPNVGYETGIIQDVILERIIDENWDILFFFTDDTLPIKKDFVPLYLEELLKPEVGICCMEISGKVTPHIRTTGWCIKKQEASNLKFAVSHITKKEDCYHFEHTGGEDTLMSQILNMDKRVIQQSSIEKSAVWDTHHTNINRWGEWHKNFPGYN